MEDEEEVWEGGGSFHQTTECMVLQMTKLMVPILLKNGINIKTGIMVNVITNNEWYQNWYHDSCQDHTCGGAYWRFLVGGGIFDFVFRTMTSGTCVDKKNHDPELLMINVNHYTMVTGGISD